MSQKNRDKAIEIMNGVVGVAREAVREVASGTFARMVCNPHRVGDALETLDAAIKRLQAARAALTKVEELWSD